MRDVKRRKHRLAPPRKVMDFAKHLVQEEAPDEKAVGNTIGDGLALHHYPDNELYEVKHSPGKGLGIFAKQNIGRGTRIFEEKPIFILRSKTDEDTTIVYDTFNKFPLEQKQRFMELHSYILPGSREVRATQIRRALQKTARKKTSYTVPEAQVSKRLEICAIYEANSFCLSHLESSSGIFWIASRLNHSCVPNVENIYNPSTSCVTIHALRKISAGEELTVSYGDSCRNRVQRESDLAFYGFTCDCTACAKTPDSWSGERRRERMYELNQELVLLDRGARTRVHGVKGACYAMSIVEELIDLMVMEGVIGREVGRCFQKAAYYSSVQGKTKKAIWWHEKELRNKEETGGGDHPDTQQTLHELEVLKTMAKEAEVQVLRSLEPLEDWFKKKWGQLVAV